MTSWPQTRSSTDSPCSRSTIGSVISASAGTSSSIAPPAWAAASADGRSLGASSPSSRACVGGDLGQGDALGQRGVPGQARVGRVAVEDAAQPLERREAPDLLAPGGHRVVGQVVRRGRVQVAEARLPARGRTPRSRGQCQSQSLQRISLRAVGWCGNGGGRRSADRALPSAARSAG